MQPVTSQDNSDKTMKDLINTGNDTPLAVGSTASIASRGPRLTCATSWPKNGRGPLALNIGGVGVSNAGGTPPVFTSRSPKWFISPAGQGKSGLAVSRKEAKPQVAAQVNLRAENNLYISKA